MVRHTLGRLRRALSRLTAARPSATLEVPCRCDDLRCEARVSVPIDVFERTAREQGRRVVSPGHRIAGAIPVLREPAYWLVELPARNDVSRMDV